MAFDARQPSPDLTGAGIEETQDAGPAAPSAPPSEAFDFFELMRRLERDGRRFGHAGRPDAEPARLGQHIRLGFAVKDVAAFKAGGVGPARVTVANFGLLGPEGPMPIHLTRWVLDRLSQRWFAGQDQRETSDTTFVDFANILQHRMIALYYRAWADNHPEVQVERKGSSGLRAMLSAMSGIGLPGTANPATDPVRLRQAAALAAQVESPERLTLFLSEAFRVPVALREFVASWTEVPRALQTRVGSAYAALGRGATIGPRVFSRQSRVELRLGPLALHVFEAFLPGGRLIEQLRTAVRELTGSALDVDLRLVLRGNAVPKARLGSARLDRTAWLGWPAEKGDAEDMLLRTFIGWRPEARA